MDDAEASVYRRVAEHLADLVLVTREETIVWASPSARLVLGRDADSLVGSQISLLVHPQDLVDLSVTEQSPIQVGRGRIRHADGEWRWVDGRITAEYDPPGQIAAVYHVWRDIHEQVLAEQGRQWAELAIAAALDASPDGFSIHEAIRDVSGQVVGMKLLFMNQSGAPDAVPTSEFIGRDLLDYHPPASTNGVFNDMVVALATGRPQARTLTHPAGDWAAGTSHVVTAPLGDDRVVATWRDITDLAIQHAVLEASHTQLEDTHTKLEAAHLQMAANVVEMARAQSRLQAALDAMPDGFGIGVAVRNLAGKVTDLRAVTANRAAAAMRGMTPEQMTGMSILDSSHPQTADLWNDVVGCLADQQPRRRRVESGTPHSSEWAVREVIMTPVGADHVTFAVRDVTDTERARHEVEARAAYAEQRADRDPLTGLPHREVLLERLDQALRDCPAGEGIGVIYLDIDRFKHINDAHGHATGDAVLHAVAERLRSLTRSGDIAARLGGDEFALIVPHLPAGQSPHHVIHRVKEQLGRPVSTPHGPLIVKVSLGSYLADPAGRPQDRDPQHVLDQADKRMYWAKRHSVPSPEQHAAAPDTEPVAQDVPAEVAPPSRQVPGRLPGQGPEQMPSPWQRDPFLDRHCGPADLAHCAGLAARRDTSDLGKHPICRRTPVLNQDTTSTVLDGLEAITDLVANWSHDAWDHLTTIPETPHLAGVRARALTCTHYAGRDNLLGYATSIIRANAPTALPSGRPPTDATQIVHDALLAMIATDLLAPDDQQTLRQRLIALSQQ